MMHQQDGYLVTEWDGTERRGIDGIALQLMAEVRSAMEKHETAEAKEMQELKTLIKQNKVESERRHEELGKRFDAMQQSTSNLLFENNKTTAEIHKLFKAAFPEGDAQAHRKAHEDWIAKSEAERKFWLSIKEKAVASIITGAVLWAGIVLWAAFVKGPA